MSDALSGTLGGASFRFDCSDIELRQYAQHHLGRCLGPASATADVEIVLRWHEGMDRVDSEGYIYPTGGVRGGHCIIVDGVVFGVEGEVDRFRLRNSWGSLWGLNGRCRIRVEDLQQLFSAGGTAGMAVDL